jgi:anti-sigma B factor antagonist
MSLEIRIIEHDHVALLEVAGRIDSVSADEFGAALMGTLDSGQDCIVIDCSQLSYLSSAGLRELVSARKRAVEDSVNGDVRIAAPSEKVAHVLQMSGLDKVFEVFETQEEAVNSF